MSMPYYGSPEQLQQHAQTGDCVIAIYQQRAYWWRITSSAEPWPEFPGPRWTLVGAPPFPPSTEDAFILARGTAGDPFASEASEV